MLNCLLLQQSIPADKGFYGFADDFFSSGCDYAHMAGLFAENLDIQK